MKIDSTLIEGVVPEDVLPALLELHQRSFASDIALDEFRERLGRKSGLLCVLARHEGRGVGYKIGYERNTDEFFSWLGGVDEASRRKGIATELSKC